MPEETQMVLTLQIEHEGDTALVKCQGRLILGTTEEFYEILKPLLPGTRVLSIDLAELDRVDSMGLGALVRLYVSAKNEGCKLQLTQVTRQLRKLLTVTKLLSVFALSEQYGIHIA